MFNFSKMAEQIDRAMYSKTDFFSNRIKPDPIARALVDSLKPIKEMNYLGHNLFPTNLIFLDEKIQNDESKVNEFISKLKLNNISKTDKFLLKCEFRKMAIEMCNTQSIIRLYVSDFYSYDHLPGYLTIPYNFEYKDLFLFFDENKNELLRIRKRVIY